MAFKLVTHASELLQCPHRLTRWINATRSLHKQIRRSGLLVPLALELPPQEYFQPHTREVLLTWLEQAKQAIAIRRAAIQESFAKANYNNLLNLRKLKKAAHGVLDRRTIQTALGKCPPRQRMWGISGKVILGVNLAIDVSAYESTLGILSSWQVTNEIVCVEGKMDSVTFWFSGPRQAGDFIAHWCSHAHSLRHLRLKVLQPLSHYIAIRPDDMLSVQEWHMASEGLDTYSNCPNCSGTDLHVLSTSATAQRFGNPNRTIRFFCGQCQTLHTQLSASPLPPCPLPPEVLQSLRKIPAGTPPLISRPIDFETVEKYTRSQKNSKKPGADGVPRELSKYSPRPFIVLYWRAFNAFARGDKPSVCEHEWQGALVTSLAKKLAASLVSDYRPVALLCSKFSLFLKIVEVNLDHATEDYALLDEAQEAFRRGRSTKRQLSKLHSILHHQRKMKADLSVILYLDIKNAFNAVNHRAIFYILEACGFHEADIALFRRLYDGSFLVMANKFGTSAACFLLRGVMQGAQPSPKTYILVIDPIHTLIRFCNRNRPAADNLELSGSGGFADDTTLKTDGPDAVPAMCIQVQYVGAYLEWTGQLVQTNKSEIVGADLRTGQALATDSITLHGKPFTVLRPDEPHKHLGVRMTMLGDFTAEKAHVLTVMSQRFASLKEDRTLSRLEKEQIIITGICSVFRYSAFIVDWSTTELDNITRSWITAYKQTWSLPNGSDGSPILLDKKDGGRGCPSAADLCTAEVLDMLEQCLSLPGEISQIIKQCLYIHCTNNGCRAINQLQQLISIRGTAESSFELFLQRLNAQGLEISSPWVDNLDGEQLILEAVWPDVHKAWTAKERWAGCRDIDDPIREAWASAKHCLHACQKLGQAAPAILTVLQLRGSQTKWLHATELKHRHCELTKDEISALEQYLSLAESRQGIVSQLQNHLSQSAVVPPPVSVLSSPGSAAVIPPYITGHVMETVQYSHVVLRSTLCDVPQLVLKSIPDEQLAEFLCQKRAIFSLPYTATDSYGVECLLPLRRAASPYLYREEFIIARLTTNETAPLTVLPLALVRDCLLGSGCDTLHEACTRPPWRVSQLDRFAGYSFPSGNNTLLTWHLSEGGVDGQRTISGLTRYFSKRSAHHIPPPLAPRHPWQSGPALPSTITIDISQHHPTQLPCPNGWQAMKRNGRVWIAAESKNIIMLDAAQYGMLVDMCTHDASDTPGPTVHLLETIRQSSRAQRNLDLEHYIHWSRHLLVYIGNITGAQLLIGASAVTYNPHFQQFVSPNSIDQQLGASDHWPLTPALLLLDSFPPSSRPALILQAAEHEPGVWVLRRAPDGDSRSDSCGLQGAHAVMLVELPNKSMVIHKDNCWEEAQWDTYPAPFKTQLWFVPGQLASQHRATSCAATFRQTLRRWDRPQYDFHWHDSPVPLALELHRKHQQDALRHRWTGLVAGTDGSVDESSETMGAGYAIGDAPLPIRVLSAPVGGPLASVRAEAASLLQLLRDVAGSHGRHTPVLIFVDCLVLLNILSKWGRHDFHPNPKEVVHFDIIFPLLEELRQWRGQITLMKIKSHAGCLMNERADEQAEDGRKADHPELCPGPQKLGSFWLRIQDQVRKQAAKCTKQLPRNSAPNRSILRAVSKIHILRAMRLRLTRFVTDLLHRKEGATVSRLTPRFKPAEYRVWLKCMEGIYPVQEYLHRIGKAPTSICRYCEGDVRETLTHFACVCPKFREARTSAHNQVRRVITFFLARIIGRKWKMFEETCMKNTGLTLSPVPAALVAQAQQRLVEDDPERLCALDRWQPDWIFVSHELKRIAIADLCRPSDVHPDQLKAAAIRKQEGYRPLLSALHHYTDQGWTVHIFPWVVGIRGLIDPSCIVSLFTFLDVPRKHHKTAIERTVLASVKALYFMHQVRFGGMHDRHRFADNPRNDSSDEDATDDEELRSDPYGRRRNRLAKTAGIRAAELHHKLVPDTVLDRRKRLVWEPIIPHSSPRGQQITTGASDISAAPDWETRKMPNMTGFNDTQTNTMRAVAARSADEAEATMSDVLALASSTVNIAVTADVAPKDAWSTIAAATPVKQEVVKYVAEETGATVNTAVSTTAQAKSMTTCAAEGVMPTCGTRLALNSGFAAVAPITGGQAEETDTRTVGSSARIDGRQSGSKRTASAHSSGSCICSKRRAGCGGDHADPGPIPAQHILPSASDALQERGPCGQTVARLNQLSELTNRVSCQSQNQPPELAVRPSSPTRPSHSLVRVQNSCPSSLSESATTLACPSQPSESYARASRVDPRPTSADQADYPSQAIELAAPIGRLHQLSDGTARAHPDRPGRPSRSSNSGLQSGCQSQSSKSAVRVSRPRQSSKSAVPAGHPSQPSESATPVNRPSHQPESAVRVSSPNQQSGIIARGHQQPCLSSESAVHTSHLARLMTSRPVRESISVDRVEETPQPTGPTRGTVPAMPVLSPAIRPVDPRRPKQRKRPLTVSASHTFDTNDPLQEPPRKRQQIPTARDNDLWTQWRNLAQDGRRST
jgi:ribonuclease HI